MNKRIVLFIVSTGSTNVHTESIAQELHSTYTSLQCYQIYTSFSLTITNYNKQNAKWKSQTEIKSALV